MRIQLMSPCLMAFVVVALSGCNSAASDTRAEWREYATEELQGRINDATQSSKNEWDAYRIAKLRATLASLQAGDHGMAPQIIWAGLTESVPWPDTYAVGAALLYTGAGHGAVVRLLYADGTVLHEGHVPLSLPVSGFGWRLTTRDWSAEEAGLIRKVGAYSPHTLLKVPASVLKEGLRLEIEQNGRVADTEEVFICKIRTLEERAHTEIAELSDEIRDWNQCRDPVDEGEKLLSVLQDMTFAGFVRNTVLSDTRGAGALEKSLRAGVVSGVDDDFATPCAVVATLHPVREQCSHIAFVWMERGFTVSGFYVTPGNAAAPIVYEDVFHWDWASDIHGFAGTLLRGQAAVVCSEKTPDAPAPPGDLFANDVLVAPLTALRKIVEIGLITQDGERVPARILSRE